MSWVPGEGYGPWGLESPGVLGAIVRAWGRARGGGGVSRILPVS